MSEVLLWNTRINTSKRETSKRETSKRETSKRETSKRETSKSRGLIVILFFDDGEQDDNITQN